MKNYQTNRLVQRAIRFLPGGGELRKRPLPYTLDAKLVTFDPDHNSDTSTTP